MKTCLVPLLAVALLAGLGCAGAVSSLLPCPQGFEEAIQARNLDTPCSVARSPERLFEASKAALAEGDLERAYDTLALLHTLHSESEESREAYVPATRLFSRLNFRYRPQRDRWDTTEPRFMFGWLEQYFEESDAFPQEQVDALFRGMRSPLFTDFLAWAEGRPALERWRMSIEKDNGIIQAVMGDPVDGPVGGTGDPAAGSVAPRS